MLCISSKHCNTQMGTLVDRDAIVGIAGEDVCIFDKNRMQLMNKEISNNTSGRLAREILHLVKQKTIYGLLKRNQQWRRGDWF